MSGSVSLEFGEGKTNLVYLHGRGSRESEAYAIAAAFPGARIRAYRGLIAEGSGFAWFRNRGIGIADLESLEIAIGYVGRWLRQDFDGRRPWLCGFSSGAAMAASLILANPDDFTGLVMIGGCLVGEKPPPGRLLGKPVLFCRGTHDMVIPRAMSAATWEYLSWAGTADAQIRIFNGGHEVGPMVHQPVSEWFLDHAGGAPIKDAG